MGKTFCEKSYLEAIEALMSSSPSFGTVGAGAYKPGLERSLEMDALLGNPSAALRCIHVAGTNGKGSVCNMLAANLASGGLKVGLYTSPHILDFRERIRIVQDGGFALVSEEWVFDFLCRHGDDMRRLGLSFFEITTAMCFSFFAEQKVDVAVIETGLGGRFDATNIITPFLSVITNIGYDHMDILGDSLEKIAAEKAGIIKCGVPVVIGEYDPVTAPVFVAAAQKAGSPIHFADAPEHALGDNLGLGHAHEYARDGNGDARGHAEQTIGNTAPEHALGDAVELPLPREMDLSGSYQLKNVRTVACALRICGLELSADAIKRAAHICGFHGRWEKLSDKPLTICDIGHNEHGLKYNFAQISDMLARGEVSDIVMVYGSVKDKDVKAALDLIPSEAQVIFTAADNPRAMDAAELRALSSVPHSETCTPVGKAVALAREKCRVMKKPLLYIGGSTYVVSEALDSMGIKF